MNMPVFRDTPADAAVTLHLFALDHMPVAKQRIKLSRRVRGHLTWRGCEDELIMRAKELSGKDAAISQRASECMPTSIEGGRANER